MAYIYNLTDTWNNAGSNFAGIKMAVTNTASGASSNLLDLTVSGATTASFKVNKSGSLSLNGTITATAGTAALPSLSTVSDNNTGLYFPAADAVAFSTGGSERMRIRSDGYIGIGGSGAAGMVIRSDNNITGATSGVGLTIRGTIQSDVTGLTSIFQSFPSTQATSFTLSQLVHYAAEQNTFGLGSTVTEQRGFSAGATLTGATNNFGFYSNIASGTGRWNFYAAGSAANFFAGGIFTGSPTGISTVNPYNAASAVTIWNIAGNTAAFATQAIIHSQSNAFAGSIAFAKSRGSNASPTIINSSDGLGAISFQGHDGTAYIQGATISAASDAAPGTGSMPGRLVFATTASGSSTPTERLRIDSSGNVGIGTSSFGTSAATVIGIANGTAPTTSPANMGQLYVENGALKYRGSSGTVTTIANA